MEDKADLNSKSVHQKRKVLPITTIIAKNTESIVNRLKVDQNGYEDITGFCKSATLKDIEENGFVLTPGRYVGTHTEEHDGEDFHEKLRTLVSNWRGLKETSSDLDALIKRNLEKLAER